MDIFGIPFSYVIFWAAAVATFIASVMAEEQDKRLKQGTFGAIAGSAVGGLAALITKDEQLLIIGFFGASIGGLAGWLVSILLSLLAAKNETMHTMLDYQIGGLKEVRDSLNNRLKKSLVEIMRQWAHNFIRQISYQKEDIITQGKSVIVNRFIKTTITGWLVSITDVLGLFFDLVENGKYRTRVAIIIFGKDNNNKEIGKYWISEAGSLRLHKRKKEFPKESIGYKVLREEKTSPYFTTADEAKKNGIGQDRGIQSYEQFYTFRLNESAILTLDWHDELKEDHPFVKEAKNLFHCDICPMISDLLEHWEGAIQDEINLQPLSS